MSRGNPKTDILSTIHMDAILNQLARNKNWLGHRVDTSAAKMDDFLLIGASVREIAKKSKTTEASVRTHINHLWREHGLKCVKDKDGKFKFDLEFAIEKRGKRKL